GRAALACDAPDDTAQPRHCAPAALGDVAFDRVHRALAYLAPVIVNAGHARLRGEGNEVRLMRREFTATQAVTFFRQHDDRTTFGRLVGERRELRGVGQFRLAHTGQRN